MKRKEATKLQVGAIINVSWLDARDEIGIIVERYLTAKGVVTGFEVLFLKRMCDVEFAQITGVAREPLNWEHFEDAMESEEGNIADERKRFMKHAAKRGRRAA